MHIYIEEGWLKEEALGRGRSLGTEITYSRGTPGYHERLTPFSRATMKSRLSNFVYVLGLCCRSRSAFFINLFFYF